MNNPDQSGYNLLTEEPKTKPPTLRGVELLTSDFLKNDFMFITLNTFGVLLGGWGYLSFTRLRLMLFMFNPSGISGLNVDDLVESQKFNAKTQRTQR